MGGGGKLPSVCGNGRSTQALGATDMAFEIPKALAEKAASFQESSYGACRATLVLGSGERVPDVLLAWGSEIISINGKPVSVLKDLPFELNEVVDVLPEK